MPCTTSLLTEVHSTQGIAVISLERRLGAQFVDALLGRLLEVERGGARLHLGAHQFEHLADHPARALHLFDLFDDLSTTATYNQPSVNSRQ